MKKAAAFLAITLLASPSVWADQIFYDALNYPNGLIETDGVWQVYSPAPPTAPYGDAFVTNDLLILNQYNHDAVEVHFTNDTASSIVFASFSIKVTTLPSVNGGYFCEFQDTNNLDEVARVFIATTGTSVPGTYRLGINNYIGASSIAAGARFYPLDLSTNVTYNVVFSYDTVQADPFPGATLVVNPSTVADYASSPAYGTDNAPTPGQTSINISQLGFSQYANQGVAEIGLVTVGTSFSDVFTNIPRAPVIGIQPHPASVYSGNSVTLYTAASGLGQLSYQWFSNSVALSDDGITVFGSASNILVLSNLQATANYSVTVTGAGGSTPSDSALVSVTNTPTPPFFTIQPVGATNSVGGSITLTSMANGTGPLTYQWYFQETNTSTFVPVAAGPTLTLPGLSFPQSGYYYVTATGGDGSQNSVTVTVAVIPPPLVAVSYLRSLMSTNNSSTVIANGQIFTIQGIVTSIGNIVSKTASEFYIQDASGGSFVYYPGLGSSNTPPAGTLIQITGPAQSYYGQLEIDPNAANPSNSLTIISTNNPLPAPLPLDLPQMATNTEGAYGLAVQCSLVTLTNVYLYSSATGAAVSGNFPTNSTKALYAFSQPYSAGQPHLEVYVYTYTNIANNLNTNYWGKPIPSFVSQLTGINAVYSPTQPELYPTRYQDFVSTPPASFPISVTVTNGVSTLSWPAVVGSTYSIYNSTNINGPWTQTFGLSYYPSTGSFTETNPADAQFWFVSTP